MFPEIIDSIQKLNTSTIPDDRKEKLQPLADWIARNLMDREPLELLFVCTHNSRRSHIAQIWAEVLGHHAGLGLKSYSAGTEVTRIYPTVLSSFDQLGFKLNEWPIEDTTNPITSIRYRETGSSIIGFSKTIDHPINPLQGFAAIMTCSEADEACPFVPGADLRVSLPFIDPKHSDGKQNESDTYLETCMTIGAELQFVFDQFR